MSSGNGNEVSTGRVRAIGTPAVRTESLWKVYEHDGIRVEAVRDVTLTIEQGEFVVLAGPSGSGKTTLLNMVGGLTRPSEGGIWIDGIDVTSLSERDLARLRLERLGFVFQAYNLLPVLTALENAEFTLLLRDVREVRRVRFQLNPFRGHPRFVTRGFNLLEVVDRFGSRVQLSPGDVSAFERELTRRVATVREACA